MIEDVLAESARRLVAIGARSAADVRDAAGPVVAFSPAMAAADRAIKAFLLPRMYRHERVMRIMRDAEGLVADLFVRYSADPQALPEEWRHGLDEADPGQRARHIADFIAGMTDRFALTEHARLFDSTPELR
jgi:dGTPase